MDSVVAQLLSRLSMFLMQEFDFELDTRRFNDDPQYATQVLDLVDETDDPEFRRVADQIKARRLQLFALRASSPPLAVAMMEEGDITSLEHERRVLKPM